MKSIVLLFFAVLAGYPCGADTLQPISQKDWQFPFADGPVVVRLTSTPSTEDGKPIYVLQIIPGRAAPSVIDEAAFLKVVTEAMEKQGMSPARVAAINLELREPDVSKRLSISAYDSQEWRDAKASDYGVVVVKLLNSTRAYEAFDHLFAQYGLSVEVTHAQYISTVKPTQIGLKQDGVSQLPSGATVQIVLRRRKAAP